MPTLLLLLILISLGLYLYLFSEADVFWGAFFSMIIFYVLIFGVGTFAASKIKSDDVTEVLLAGRRLPLFIAIFTMAATWIGGGFINGTAEYAATSGLVWVQAPWGYALSLIVGGLFFARIMRRYEFKTMLDPLGRRFGERFSSLYFLPALAGEVFWTAAILTALGTTFATVLGIDTSLAIIISAIIALMYTALGGLWAVAYTDVIQLILLIVGLVIVVPSALGNATDWSTVWSAYVEKKGAAASLFPSRDALGSYYWNWWDYAFLLVLGGIPWQVYFQRVLSAKDENTAANLSFFAGIICLIVAIPAAMIGIVADVTDWSTLGLSAAPDGPSTLPYVIRYMTHPVISTIGLGAIAAAVMSSVDSSILSASSLASWNVYRPLVKPKIDSASLRKVIKRSIWIIGTAATLLALKITSIYELWFLCSDFVYCLIFPALFCALFDKKANFYGAASGFVVSFILRFGGGDATLGLPIILPYPMIEEGVVLFPFRSFSMICGLLTIILVSRFTQHIEKAKPLENALNKNQ